MPTTAKVMPSTISNATTRPLPPMRRPLALTLTMHLPTSTKALPSIILENQEKLRKLTIRLVSLVIQVREFFSQAGVAT
jgi:hypothetical protein